MDKEQFFDWLVGFIEIADPKTITEDQIKVIKDHITLVKKEAVPPKPYFPSYTPVPNTYPEETYKPMIWECSVNDSPLSWKTLC